MGTHPKVGRLNPGVFVGLDIWRWPLVHCLLAVACRRYVVKFVYFSMTGFVSPAWSMCVSAWFLLFVLTLCVGGCRNSYWPMFAEEDCSGNC